MISIDLNILNPLEKEIHRKMVEASKSTETIRINQAAELCQCSVSKISKFVKKAGFNNYKQYLNFLCGRSIDLLKKSDELIRLKAFIEGFNRVMVDELFELINQHEKIVLFGYGPSMICGQYFEYRFRNCSDKMVIAANDEVGVSNIIDENTLLIIITVTGRFHSFKDIYESSRTKGCNVAIIVEEYNMELFNQCDKIFWLSENPQPPHLEPYEKSRTTLFIFLEEIIQKFLKNRETADSI